MESAPKLSTPEEELAYLREQVVRKEAELASGGTRVEREHLVSEQLRAHHAAPVKVLAPEMRMSESQMKTTATNIMAELNLGDSEQTVAKLQKTMKRRGLRTLFPLPRSSITRMSRTTFTAISCAMSLPVFQLWVPTKKLRDLWHSR